MNAVPSLFAVWLRRVRVRLALLLLSSFTAPGQGVLRGRVRDAETHQAIPNAQVGVAANRLGTSTNEDGDFTLNIPPEYQREMLEVALLGYRKFTRSVPLLPGPVLLIELQISPAALGEVRVTGSVLGLVREAVARIPRNYPARPTRLTGFYRESDNDPAGAPRYLVEGVLRIFKIPYRQRARDGVVQIEQARQVDLRPAPAERTDWAGGPFIAHRADFVHARAQFIDPAHFRDYDYRLAPGSAYQDRPVYVVTFAPRPGNRRAEFQGRLYIDQASYAFVGAEWHYTAVGLHRSWPAGPAAADSRQLRVSYQPYAGRWQLQSVWWQTRYRPLAGPPLHYFGEFLTTAIDTAQTPQPGYRERAQYHDTFLANTGRYDSTFWQSRTTLLPSASLRRALLDPARQQRADSLFVGQAAAPSAVGGPGAVVGASPVRSPLGLLGRIRYGAVGGAWPLMVPGAGLAVDFVPAGSGWRATGTADVMAQRLTGWWSGEYLFDLTPELAVRLATRSVFRQFTGAGWDAGLSYQRNLNPRRRPLFGRVGLAYTRQTVARRLGSFPNGAGGVRVAGTSLRAAELGLELQTVSEAIQPTLGLGLEISHKIELVADLGYLLPLRTRTQLRVSEASGFFLTRRSATVDLPTADVSLRVNEHPTTAAPWSLNPWLLSFGLLYRFR